MPAYHANIELYKGLIIKIGLAVNGTGIKSIRPNMSECTLNMHTKLTFTDYLKYIANMFGGFFKITNNTGSIPYRTFKFHEQGTNRYIAITCEEKYSNILGNYLFGKDWDYKHLEQDRNWVLHIHSPWFSEKFKAAKGNLIEQRRLIYLALAQSTAEADVNVLKQFKYIAKLTSNVTAKKEGLTVYTYKWNGNNIEPESTPLQYEPYNDIEWEDAKYPINIKLWDGNNQPALGLNFYGTNQFRKGKFSQFTIGLGPFVPGGMGKLRGYLKGFGYCEFTYLNYNGLAISFDFGAEFGAGIIEGKYMKQSGIPNPVNFSGPGSNISYSSNDFNGPIVIELSDWEGYDKNNKLTWKGTSFGFEIEFSGEISLPVEKENVKVYTELTFPVLDKNSETYKTLDKKPYK